MLTLLKRMLLQKPSHLNPDYEDLGSPVVKPTDSNPDGTKKVNKVSDAVSKSSSGRTFTFESRISRRN